MFLEEYLIFLISKIQHTSVFKDMSHDTPFNSIVFTHKYYIHKYNNSCKFKA